MTLNFKTGAVIAGLVLALILPLVSFSQQGVMHRGDLTVDQRRLVEDVVVADGNLVVRGRVTGSVFLVNGDASVEPFAAVDGNLTVLGGSLWVSRGASVGGEINVFSGKAHIEEGAGVGSQVRALEEVPSLTDEKLALVSRYIIFNRKAPGPGYRLENLDALDLEALKLRKAGSGPALQLDFARLGKQAVNLDEIEGSREVVFRDHDLRVIVSTVRFASDDNVNNFWDRLRGDYEEKVSHSVHNSLGEGAHWYFRYRGASFCIWHKDRVLQSVVVWHEDDDPDEDEWEEVESLRDRIILEVQNYYDLTGEQ